MAGSLGFLIGLDYYQAVHSDAHHCDAYHLKRCPMLNREAFTPVYYDNFVVRLASKFEDFENIHNAERAEMGDAAEPPSEIKRVWDDYPYGMYVLEELGAAGASYVGTFLVIPVDEKVANDFRQGRVGYKDLDQANLKLATVAQAGWSVWRIWLLQIVPAYRKQAYRHLIPWLLAHAFDSWAESGAVRYPVEIFTTGYTAEGEAMLRRFGFQMETPGEKMAGGKPCYSRICHDKNEIFVPLFDRGLDHLLPVAQHKI